MKNELLNQIAGQETPNVKIYVDESCDKFWITAEGEYIFLASRASGEEFASYIDADHQPSTENRPEYMHNTGAIWNNIDFNSPFYADVFIAAIEKT